MRRLLTRVVLGLALGGPALAGQAPGALAVPTSFRVGEALRFDVQVAPLGHVGHAMIWIEGPVERQGVATWPPRGACASTSMPVSGRFLPGQKAYVAARVNTVSGDLGITGAGATLQDNSDISTRRLNIGGGWFLTPSILMKAEHVTQTFDGFARRDIRSGGKFNGFMLEAVTAW